MEGSKGEGRTNMTLKRGGRIEKSSRQEEGKRNRGMYGAGGRDNEKE